MSAMIFACERAVEEARADPSGMERGRKTVNLGIRRLMYGLRVEKNLGAKKHLEASIAHLKVLRQSLEPRQGGGLTSRPEFRSDRIKWENLRSAFASRIRTGVIINLRHIDTLTFLEDALPMFRVRIAHALKQHPQLKVNLDFCGKFERETDQGMEQDLKHFTTANQVIDCSTDIKAWWSQHVEDDIIVKVEDFQQRASGWRLVAVINLTVCINRYEPLRGSSYCPLPPQIARRKGCINVMNTDDMCFAWATVSTLFPCQTRQNAHRPGAYPHPTTTGLDWSGLTWPMTLDQVPKFEARNAISVNVFTLEPLRKTFKVVSGYVTAKKMDRHVNLLLIQDTYDDSPNINYHFVWVKNLSRLVSKQMSARDHKAWMCDRCLQGFRTYEKLQRHERDCEELNDCRVVMPTEKERFVKFTNTKNKLRVPFVVFADTECLLVPECEKKGRTIEMFQRHEPFALGYYLKCSYDDSLSYYRSHRGPQCVEWFCRQLAQLAKDIEMVHKSPKPLRMSAKNEEEFQTAIECHICEKVFQQGEARARDHDHLSGVYRGAAHEGCNLNYQDSKMVPVVFHNLSSYDAHFLIRDLATEVPGPITVIPNNAEKYISFSKYVDGCEISFRFVDSLRFMAASLDELASYLDDYKITRREWADLSPEQFSLLTKKGALPYDCLSSWSKLEESQLPSEEAFVNRLTAVDTSGLDHAKREAIRLQQAADTARAYEHAQLVWNIFECTTLSSYADLYMKTDILLLADVFENFRDTCMDAYKLDPARYLSAPGLTWDAMLKFTGVELELITDIDQLLFVERGIRGGLSQCSNRYAKANNPHCPDYDASLPTSYLMYYDVNMYGDAMMQYLPTGGFAWVEEPQDITKVPDDSPVGYMLEVDLEYPVELHDRHADLPFCPRKECPPGSRTSKLLATLFKKERYVIHYRALKQAMQHGVKVLAVHRILQFDQSDWLAKYISHNVGKRQEAVTAFAKNFYKLMVNACFGKTMEDVRKRRDIKIVTKWDGRYAAKVLIAKPNFKGVTILGEDLVLIEMGKNKVKMNKPIYIGMSVLDISKIRLYDFHYNFMVPLYGHKCKVMYTDTDSLIYHVTCPDIYEDMKKHIARFDTSDYPEKNRFGMPRKNKKVPGLMKDENCGRVMTEFVGLRAKMYAVRVEGQDAVKKAKGVKGNLVKKTLCFDDYVRCLRERIELVREQNSIQSRQHNVHTIRQTKVALSPHDDKRALLPGTSDTLPWGHFRVKGRLY